MMLGSQIQVGAPKQVGERAREGAFADGAGAAAP